MTHRQTGLQLAEDFYRVSVKPALATSYPNFPHAAGVMGRGSEVLGFDDAMSGDHDWSARVTVFVPDSEADASAAIQEGLRTTVPPDFDGCPTVVDVSGVSQYFRRQLDLDPTAEWDAADWVSLPEHRLCALTAGAVFHDEIGLQGIRDRLSYYPDDVWYYLLIAGCWRVHPEMNLVGRTGYSGDDLGSALITADMVDGLMRLAFLINRRYAPYRKWFGTAFNQLPLAARLQPALTDALRGKNWQERERALNTAYEVVADAFNNLSITAPLTLEATRLWDRPFTVMWADFPAALSPLITDLTAKDLLRRWPAGGIDQVRNLLWAPSHRTTVRQLAAG